MDLLDAAGLLGCVDNRGYQVKPGAKILAGDQQTTIDFTQGSGDGWAYTWNVDRADFDHALARGVEAMGVPVEYEVEVTEVVVEPTPQVTVSDASGTRTLCPRFVVDASGYGRVLPRLLALDAPAHQPPRTAIFCHVRGDARPEPCDHGHIWLCIQPDTWSWFIPLSEDRTSVGAIAAPEVFDALEGSDEDKLRALVSREPNAAARLAGAELLFEPRSATAWARKVHRYHGANFCLVGNATEFIDPVLSSGIALALESAQVAAGLIARTLAGEPDVDWDNAYVAHMRQGMGVFQAFVDAWYDGTFAEVVFAKAQPLDVRRQITSILAGYVWDGDNPFTIDAGPTLRRLARKIRQRRRLAGLL